MCNMIQYIFLLINNVVLKIGSAIDAGFANSISLGVICVFGIDKHIAHITCPAFKRKIQKSNSHTVFKQLFILWFNIIDKLKIIRTYNKIMYHSVVLVLAGTGVSYFISFVLLYLNAPFRKDCFKTVDVIVILKDGLPLPTDTAFMIVTAKNICDRTSVL